MTTGFPEPGEQLGPFRVGARLGLGGMGVVFRALDTQLNRHVALKIIAPHLSNDADFRARFTREAQAQASLDSPHVVGVYSFGEADGRLYIATQLIPDGDLGQMLARHGTPPARIALTLIAQVADGLADAHAAGLIHRDIKPANVLLRNRDHALHAYLADFGIARQATDNSLTQHGSVVGTPTYMAPELHLNGDAGPASDIYSLGCLLWATLSGAGPYAGGTDFQIISAHVEAPVPQVVESGPLAAEINRVLRTALAKRPGDRYPSASAMRDDLRRVVRLPDDRTPIRVAGEPTPATPPPTQAAWQLAASRTPTPPPTPTPTPTPAPAAPPFRGPGTGATPVFTHYPSPSSPPSGPPSSSAQRAGRGRLWLVIGVVALLVVAAVVVALLLTRSDDEAGPDDDPSSSASTSAAPTDSAARDEAAVEAMSGVFADQAGLGEEGGRCIAQELVDDLGVDGLIEAGVLTDDLELNQGNLEDPDVVNNIVSATFACADTLPTD